MISHVPGSPIEEYLSALARQPIPRTARGFLRCGPTTAEDLGQAGQTMTQAGLSLPVAVLRVGALDHNIARMQRWAAERGAELAPHVKTTMAPWIMARQLAAGAWALTVATCTQAQVCVDLGAPRVLIANEVVDPADVAWLAAQLREPGGTRLICYVDSLAGVGLLADGLSSHQAGRPLDLLVEMGGTDGRAGCRGVAEAVAVADRASRSPLLRVRGAGGFEGVIATGRAYADLAQVDAFCDRIHSLGDALVGAGLVDIAREPLILSAAGSIYFDRVAARLGRPLPAGHDPLVVLRSGGYISHDHGYLDELSPLTGTDDVFAPALEIQARVVSVPQDDLAVIGAGKRDVGTDIGLPIVLGCLDPDEMPRRADGLYVDRIFDQHAVVRPRSGGNLRGELAVADTVRLGISHPCTTFDRWQHLIALDDHDRIVDVVRTFFG
jgi:D-serine deaminase-like pyridoxal phosphate-dependent protein